MIWRHIILAVRLWNKQPVIALIKVFCLTLGMTATLVIAAYINFEKSYDRSFPFSENIYRVTVEYHDDGRFVHMAKNYAPFADIIQDKITSVEAVTRMFPQNVYLSSEFPQREKFRDQICFVDSTFFDVYALDVVESTGGQSLTVPFTAVVTESGAMRIFGRTTEVVGEKLHVENDRRKYEFVITAVVKDILKSTHFNIDFFASFSTLTTFYPQYNNWHYPPMYIYVRSTPEADHFSLQHEIQNIAEKFQPDYVNEEKRVYTVQPAIDIHLQSALEGEWKTNGDIAYVNLFMVVGAIILSLACLNYINLSNATALRRMKEVGIRKVSGAARHELYTQFITESFLATIISFLCALVLSELVLLFLLNDIAEKPLSLEFLLSPLSVCALAGLWLIVSFLAGTYPAFFAARFNVLEAVKGITNSGFKLSGLTRTFVAIQFFAATVMTIFTFIMLTQISFLKSAELGFAQDEIVTLHMPDKFSSGNVNNLKEKLLKENMVLSASVTSTVPGEEDFFAFPAKAEGHETGNDLTFQTLGVDEDFLDTYGIRLVRGDDFSKAGGLNNNGSFIINMAAAKAMGWVDAPLGKKLSLTVYTGEEEVRHGQVIGVVEDFHFKSLYEKIEPLIIYVNKHIYYTDYLSVRVKPGNVRDVAALLQKRWKEFNSEKPVELSFLNDHLDSIYRKENKRADLLIMFSFLCIAIAGLGLFGLTAQAANSKTKESAIRKVLGASWFAIGWVLAGPMMRIIVVATVIAVPTVWLLAVEWLSTFAYHITPRFFDFIVPLALVVTFGLLTMATHIGRMVLEKPVSMLKRDG